MVTLQAAMLALAVTGAGETVLYDFSAPWCGPCRQMDPIVDQLRQQGHPIQKVNIDQDRARAAQFGVSNIPCFVMVVDGREVDRVVGATSQARLTQMLAHAPQVVRGQNPAPLAPVAKRSRPRVSSNGLSRGAGGATSPARQSATSPKPLAASVRLKVEDPDGYSIGSGTIIDARAGEALVLTCGHIFRDSHGQGRVLVDLFAPGAPRGLEGTLIRYDLERDLALVSIRPGTAVTVAELATAASSIRAGDAVVSIGCDHGSAPRADASAIASVDRYIGPSNLQVSGQPADGRSGGGLFNAAGQLIGVCYGGDPADNEGLYTAISAVRAELADAGLVEMIAADVPGGNSTGTVTQVSDTSRGMSKEPSFTPEESAALASAGDSRNSAEVICIVRPLNKPGAKSDVFVLDKPSADFLNRLSSERRRQGDRQLTSLRRREKPVGTDPSRPASQNGAQPLWSASKR